MCIEGRRVSKTFFVWDCSFRQPRRAKSWRSDLHKLRVREKSRLKLLKRSKYYKRCVWDFADCHKQYQPFVQFLLNASIKQTSWSRPGLMTCFSAIGFSRLLDFKICREILNLQVGIFSPMVGSSVKHRDTAANTRHFRQGNFWKSRFFVLKVCKLFTQEYANLFEKIYIVL